jgi:hypothetical protein
VDLDVKLAQDFDDVLVSASILYDTLIELDGIVLREVNPLASRIRANSSTK